jgi:hypothetical protein
MITFVAHLRVTTSHFQVSEITVLPYTLFLRDHAPRAKITREVQQSQSQVAPERLSVAWDETCFSDSVEPTGGKGGRTLF